MKTAMTKTTRLSRVITLLAVIAVMVGFGAAPGASAQEAEGARWVTAWATSQQALGAATISNATVRMIARVTAGGESVRIRLDNTFGTDPLIIGAAYVGPVMRGAALAPGSNRPLRFGGSPGVTIAPGMRDIADRVKAQGVSIIGTTIIPRHNRPARGTNSGWTPAKTRIRREVNDWIRSGGVFDGVIDFDAIVRDAADPDRIAAAFDCDGIHPNPRGYFEMGGAVALELFTR